MNVSETNELSAAEQGTLQLLIEIEHTSSVSQRELSARIGLALGFTNGLIKRAILKGLLKAHEAPAKRYAYYLTPKGFAEKSRLVGEYLSSSLDFFRMARSESSKLFQRITNSNHQTIILYGVSELAEITIMAARVENTHVKFIVDPTSELQEFSGISTHNNLEFVVSGGVDAVIITHSEQPQAAYNHVRQFMNDEQIYAAPFLHLSRQVDVKMEVE